LVPWATPHRRLGRGSAPNELRGALCTVATTFTKLNDGWNAEPNAPDAAVVVEGADVLLYFDLNPFQFPQFEEGQRAHLRFVDSWRYRLGSTNDEGWFRGQCRFSGLAPAWAEFYLRDDTFECDARAFRLDLG
jgi:hypothetical protein